MGSDAEQVASAFAEVQRRSLEAAAAVVDRLVALVDGSETGAASPAGEGAGPADGIARLWQSSVSQLAQVVPGLAPDPGIEIGSPGAGSSIAIVVDAATRVGTVEVWLHNHSDEGWSDLRVHAGVPRNHTGSELPSLTFDPEVFDLPPRSSRGVVVSATAPGEGAGAFRSIVLVEGAPEQCLVVTVEVP